MLTETRDFDPDFEVPLLLPLPRAIPCGGRRSGFRSLRDARDRVLRDPETWLDA